MKILHVVGIPLALSACTVAPELVTAESLAPAANEQAQIRHIHGPAVMSGYTSRPVTDPANWRELNDQQAPSGEGEG